MSLAPGIHHWIRPILVVIVFIDLSRIVRRVTDNDKHWRFFLLLNAERIGRCEELQAVVPRQSQTYLPSIALHKARTGASPCKLVLYVETWRYSRAGSITSLHWSSGGSAVYFRASEIGSSSCIIRTMKLPVPTNGSMIFTPVSERERLNSVCKRCSTLFTIKSTIGCGV